MCFIFSKKAREERKARRTILKMDDMAVDCIVKIQELNLTESVNLQMLKFLKLLS